MGGGFNDFNTLPRSEYLKLPERSRILRTPFPPSKAAETRAVYADYLKGYYEERNMYADVRKIPQDWWKRFKYPDLFEAPCKGLGVREPFTNPYIP